MNIYITGLSSGYEVEHLVRLFYPMAPLTLIPPEDGADCVWAEKRPDKLWAERASPPKHRCPPRQRRAARRRSSRWPA